MGRECGTPSDQVRNNAITGEPMDRKRAHQNAKQVAREIVVETRGGTIVGIYCDDRDLRVIVVNWHEYHDEGRAGIVYNADPASSIPEDTRRLVDAAN